MTTTSAGSVTAYLSAPPQGSRVTNKERGLRHCTKCGAVLRKKRPEMDIVMQILREVSEEHGISIAQMQGKSRNVEIVDARSCASHRWREELELELKTIGSLLGGRDHSTVINLLKRTPTADLRCNMRRRDS